MNVLVIGASGRVGSALVERLLEKGHKIYGTTRRQEPLFEHENYKQIQLDLAAPKSFMKESLPDDLDAMYFTSGSRGKDLLKVDLHGGVKTMQVAEALGVKRYIMLSGFHSLKPTSFHEERVRTLMDYYIAKHYADVYLMENTDLDYTILQPGPLTEGESSGSVQINAEQAKDSNIGNVAETLVEILDKPNTFKKAVPMSDGEMTVGEAVLTI